MKITRFRLSRLYNEEWSAYETFLIKIIRETGADNLNLVAILEMLEKNAGEASEALELISKSEYTRLTDEADDKRDKLIGAINNYIRSFLYDGDSIIQNAARNLMVVIDHYAGMANENRDQESGRIINFVDELKENHAEDIAKFNEMKKRIMHLSEANNEYIDLQDKRTFANADKPSIRMTNVRKDGNQYIYAVWNMMDIMLLSPTDSYVDTFVARLNTENRNEHTKLAQRKGRADVKKETGEEDDVI